MWGQDLESQSPGVDKQTRQRLFAGRRAVTECLRATSFEDEIVQVRVEGKIKEEYSSHRVDDHCAIVSLTEHVQHRAYRAITREARIKYRRFREEEEKKSLGTEKIDIFLIYFCLSLWICFRSAPASDLLKGQSQERDAR